MTGTLRRQDGFTLIELLLVCVVSLIVFGVTLTAWTSVYRSNRAVELQQDNTQAARLAIDRASRQLRNLANPTVNAVTTIDRADPYDFIFQTSDPAKTWVRYCLQTSGGSTSVNKATLWEHESAETITTITDPMKAGCPSLDSKWTTKRAVVQSVTNQAGGIDRPIFSYECAVGSPTGCPASIADHQKILNVGLDLWVDADRSDRASELNVATSVFLRNQNETPTARGSATRYAPMQLLLNGSGSTDPEGRTLEFFWFEDAPPSETELKSTACTAKYPSAKWEGVTYIRKYDATVPVGTVKTFYLVVRDPGCLSHVSDPITGKVT
jgi:prepilin-type N-terminal cleavage/methylation domain-containing protein